MDRPCPELGTPQQVIRTVFGCAPEDVAERVIVSPFVPLKVFRRHVQGEVQALAPPFFYTGFSATYNGHPVSVIHTGVGPSRVGDCLGFLSLTPARHVCFVGAVGALDPDYRIGEFFIPEAAGDGEGFSCYTRGEFAELVRRAPAVPCPNEGRTALEHILTDAGFAIRSGRVFTIGSITSECPENLRTLRDSGFDAVEMELTAFYAAAAHYQLRPSALTYVSDLPLESSLWEPKSPRERDALRAAYRALPRLALTHLCCNI